MSDTEINLGNLRVYIASPLFCDEDNAKIDKIESTLKKYGIEYFSPRDEGENIGALPPEERQAAAKRIFDGNVKNLDWCNCVIGMTDSTNLFPGSTTSDVGTVWELGYMYSRIQHHSCGTGRELRIVTCSDMGYGANIMITESVDCHLPRIDMLDAFLRDLSVADEVGGEMCNWEATCEKFHSPQGEKAY